MSLTLRVYAGGDARIFATHPNGRAITPPRFVARDPNHPHGPLAEGEDIPAVRTNAGLQPASALYRAALACGDLSLTPPVPVEGEKEGA